MRTHSTAVSAHARVVAAAADGGRGTVLPVLHGEGPFALRRLRAPNGCEAARVCLVGAMSAPLNGDRLRLDVDAGAGARLHLTTAAATVALPGRDAEATGPATYDLRLRAAEHARLHWLPEPSVAAAGSVLHTTTRVDLAATAHLVLREELVLGRSGEAPGSLTSRLTLHRAGIPLLDQRTAHGDDAAYPGWDGPAGVAGHRAVGQVLYVGEDFAHPPEAEPLATGPGAGEAAAFPLAEAVTLVTAVAPDALRLRRVLDTALARTRWT